MRIDAHVMFRKPAHLPGDLWPRLESNRFDGCIAVQTESDLEEARWLLSLAQEHPFVRGVVLCTDVISTLDEFLRDSHFCGISAPAAPSLEFLRELERRNIPLEINGTASEYERIANAAPELRLVTQARAGLPRIPNLYVKLAGLTGPAEVHKELVEEMFETFGPAHLMFGSNWPVCLAAGIWKATLATFTQALGPRTMQIRSQILGETAAALYKLS